MPLFCEFAVFMHLFVGIKQVAERIGDYLLRQGGKRLSCERFDGFHECRFETILFLFYWVFASKELDVLIYWSYIKMACGAPRFSLYGVWTTVAQDLESRWNVADIESRLEAW
jgi:hypothetical protein